MFVINTPYLSQNHVLLDIEARASVDKIERIRVWNDEAAEYLAFDHLNQKDQNAIIELIWEKVVLEDLADREEKQRMRDGFQKVWVEATSKAYVDWINGGSK